MTYHIIAPTGSPRDIRANNVVSSALELLWDPPLLAEQNGYIQYYSIDVYIVDTGKMFTIKTDDDGTSKIIANLHPFFIYQFEITATTSSGQGPFSETYQIHLPEDCKNIKILLL